MRRRNARRAFARDLAALAGSFGLLCLPVKVYPQQPASPRRIGVLLVGTPPGSKQVRGLTQGLEDAGYVEGRDVRLEWRSAKGDYDRLPELAADLVNSKVDVIVVEHTLAVLALKRATSSIPIVMAIVADPLGGGLVDSLSRPGGNVTGLSLMTADLVAKRLQLLIEAMPQATRIAVLWNPATPFHVTTVQALKAVAPGLLLELQFVPVQRPEDFDVAFSAIGRARAQALYIMEGPPFSDAQTTLSHVSKARLPAIHATRWFAEGGGLMSYGANQTDMYRRAAVYVDKILKGAKPSELPIEQPTKFELVVNLKTAKALGITIPQSILVRADEVIR
jgi:putative ABC transport system substrate-binding protein